MMKPPQDEHPENEIAPLPVVQKRSLPSLVWLIPLVTVLIGGWLVFKTLNEQGPRITITFSTAEGIEAGKTKIRFKEIEVGIVEAVHFSGDLSHVVLEAAMAKESEPLLRRGTRFWVVKPHLSLYGVSNLGTLVSGVYIDMEPGQGAFQRNFEGEKYQPVVKSDVPGTEFTLLAKTLGSIDIGSPLYYRGIPVGEVLGWELANDRKSILIHAFVKSPYDELVQSNTRFWNVSGLDVSVDSGGLRLRTESVRTILFGGIAFETPETLKPADKDIADLVFTLHENYQSIKEQAFTRKITFILFFDGSVRGLNVGAPVEFKGIKVGSVIDVRLEYDSRDSSFRIPVLIEIEPERVIEKGDSPIVSPYQTLQTLVERGLRAQLQSGSLLTGQLFVELDMHPDTPVELVGDREEIPELPTIPSNLEQMATSVKSILADLETVDIERIGSELLETLQAANRFASGADELIRRPELRQSVEDLQSAISAFRSILQKVDQQVEPVTVHLDDALGAGQQALVKAQETMKLIDDVLQPDSPLQYRFVELSEELAETARSIRALVDLLERNPNSLIFGKNPPGGP